MERSSVKRFVALAIFISTAPLCFGQTKTASAAKHKEPVDPDTPVVLIAAKSIPILNVGGHGLLGRFACDADRNIFLRITDGPSGSVAPPYQKYTATGEKKATFEVPALPGIELEVAGLDIGADEDYYAPAAAYPKKPGQRAGYVFKYDKDGQLKGTIKLEPAVKPRVALAFKDGSMLVSGVEVPPDKDSSKAVPFTGILDSSGKLLKRITLADEDSLRKKADLGDSEIAGEHRGYNRAVEWGTGIIGSDGYAYLMRAVSPTTIYVVSPAGEVVRTFEVNPSAPGLTALWLHESNGYLAVQFSNLQAATGGARQSIIKVVSSTSGDVVATYDATEMVAGLLCFSYPADFIFGGYVDRKISFNFAQPQ